MGRTARPRAVRPSARLGTDRERDAATAGIVGRPVAAAAAGAVVRARCDSVRATYEYNRLDRPGAVAAGHLYRLGACTTSASGRARMIDLTRYVRDVPDFPKPGIVFKDITPLLGDAQALRSCVAMLGEPYRDVKLDAICA